jgi:membrane fusion protein, heavy metal efflux system
MSSPSTVLVLSPDPLVEMVVRHLLPVEQYAVRRITDRGEVAPLLEQEARLAVLDMPEMDAVAVAFVRDLHTRAGKPLLVLTTDPGQLAGQLEPAVRLLDRPPQLDQLQAALNAALAEPAAPALPPGPPAGRNRRRLVSLVGVAVLAVVAVILIGPMVGVPGMPNLLERYLAKKEEARTSSESVTLLPGQTDAFELPADVVAQMKIPKPHRIEKTPKVRTQTFSGTLAFDPDRLARIQSRFPGEVIAVGTVDGKSIDETKSRSQRGSLLQVGNRVVSDQPLAVVWSSALGDKKSDLVDALAQYNLASEDVKNLIKIENSVSNAVLRAAKTRQEQTRILMERAEYALRTWKVSDEEIKAVKEEADRIIKRRGKVGKESETDKDRRKYWARVEIHAPIGGVIVEKNVVRGNIIDSTQDLFKIADLTTLAVYVHIYEEDQQELQKLQKDLQEKQKSKEPVVVPWRLYLTSDPHKQLIVSPGIKRLGVIVDPTQHTNLAVGYAMNKDRLLSVGQFVTAEIDIPAPPDVVSIPVGALDEDGATSHVLIQLDPDHHRYALRRVRVLQRFLDFAYVSSKLDDSDRAAGLSELKPGDLIITGGAVQLKPALEEAQARAKAQAKAKQ